MYYTKEKLKNLIREVYRNKNFISEQTESDTPEDIIRAVIAELNDVNSEIEDMSIKDMLDHSILELERAADISKGIAISAETEKAEEELPTVA